MLGVYLFLIKLITHKLNFKIILKCYYVKLNHNDNPNDKVSV